MEQNEQTNDMAEKEESLGQKIDKKRQFWNIIFPVLGVIILAIIIAGAIYYYKKHGERVTVEEYSNSPSASSEVISTPSSSGTVSVTPSLSTSSVSPSATASASPEVQLPQTIKSFLANFYNAYKNMETKSLEALFTEDNTNLRSTLFTGVDTSGVPGGPTLFATNTAGERAISYQVTSAIQTGDNWLVTLSENRVDLQGNEIKSATSTQISLIPSGSSWLIDRYSREGQTGKYNAFLAQ